MRHSEELTFCSLSMRLTLKMTGAHQRGDGCVSAFPRRALGLACIVMLVSLSAGCGGICDRSNDGYILSGTDDALYAICSRTRDAVELVSLDVPLSNWAVDHQKQRLYLVNVEDGEVYLHGFELSSGARTHHVDLTSMLSERGVTIQPRRIRRSLLPACSPDGNHLAMQIPVSRSDHEKGFVLVLDLTDIEEGKHHLLSHPEDVGFSGPVGVHWRDRHRFLIPGVGSRDVERGLFEVDVRDGSIERLTGESHEFLANPSFLAVDHQSGEMAVRYSVEVSRYGELERRIRIVDLETFDKLWEGDDPEQASRASSPYYYPPALRDRVLASAGIQSYSGLHRDTRTYIWNMNSDRTCTKRWPTGQLQWSDELPEGWVDTIQVGKEE